MKLIGVTCNIYEDKQTQTLAQTYTECLQAVGALPMLLGIVNQEQAERAADVLDGLLLSGGGDIAPHLFGEQPHEHLGQVTPTRDTSELLLTEAFLKRGKPIFGICRGIQVLAVALGATLWQDLPSQVAPADNHKDGWHQVDFAKGSFLHDLYGDTMEVNSLHHQSVKHAGEKLRVVAQTQDDARVIEAVEGIDVAAWGVQWHPERMWNLDKRDEMSKLFEWFVARC